MTLYKLPLIAGTSEKMSKTMFTFVDGMRPRVLSFFEEADLPCRMHSKGLPCHQNFDNWVAYSTPPTTLRGIHILSANENADGTAVDCFSSSLKRFPSSRCS